MQLTVLGCGGVGTGRVLVPEDGFLVIDRCPELEDEGVVVVGGSLVVVESDPEGRFVVLVVEGGSSVVVVEGGGDPPVNSLLIPWS